MSDDEKLKQAIKDLNEGIDNIEKSGEDQYYVVTKEETEEFRKYLEELLEWRTDPFKITTQLSSAYHSGDENNPCFGCHWSKACGKAGAGAPEEWGRRSNELE